MDNTEWGATGDELLNFIQKNEAWLTFASDQPPERAWRCHVVGRTYFTPDIRERAERTGFGVTAREAIVNCATS